MKRKIMVLLTVGIVATAIAGCGSSSDADDSAQTGTNVNKSEETQVEDSTGGEMDVAAETDVSEETETVAEGKVLVVYYSATGTTQGVAERIAEMTDGELFALEPVEPYTSDELDWTDRSSRVSLEYENPDTRNIELVADTIENWESYETVFIGYPIWWGIAAWPVNGFVEANDFTGKTVIPFCTASSSGIGDSGELLEELTGSGTWLAGERFRSSTSDEDLQDWIEGLEIRIAE